MTDYTNYRSEARDSVIICAIAAALSVLYVCLSFFPEKEWDWEHVLGAEAIYLIPMIVLAALDNYHLSRFFGDEKKTVVRINVMYDLLIGLNMLSSAYSAYTGSTAIWIAGVLLDAAYLVISVVMRVKMGARKQARKENDNA